MRFEIGAAALGALLAGCLGSPTERTCADYPRDTPECAAYWAGVGGADGEVDRDGGAVDAGVDAAVDAGDAAIDAAVDAALDAGDAGVDAGGCAEGETRRCEGIDEGACSPGEQTCADGVFGPCEGVVEPADEGCNGVDDDCDGTIDEAVVEGGAACVAAEREACGTAGVVACVLGGAPELVCEAAAAAGEAEADDGQCDAIDDDCDGFVDEDSAARVRSQRLPATVEATPALIARGDHFVAAWLDADGAIQVASLGGRGYVIEPRPLFGGGGRASQAVALGRNDDGELLALSYCDEFGCASTVSLLGDGLDFADTLYFGPDGTTQMSVAGHGAAVGVAWAVQGALGFTHADDFALDNAPRHVISSANDAYSQPALAWQGAQYGLVYVAGPDDGRGVVEFRALAVDGSTQAMADLSGDGASAPAIAALRGHGGYAVSWIETVDGLSTARAAIVDGAGATVAGPFELGPGVASPTVVPYDDGLAASVDRVGISWLAQERGQQRMTTRWLDRVGASWSLSAPARVATPRVASGLVGAYSVDAGPGHLLRDVDVDGPALLALTGDPGCPASRCEPACGDDALCVGQQCVFFGTCAHPRPLVDTAQGTTVGAPMVSNAATCSASAGTAPAPEVVFVFRPDVAREVCLSTALSGFDTLLYVRRVCDDAGSEVACSEDAGLAPRGTAGAVTLAAEAGVDYYVYIDGYVAAALGEFVIEVLPGPCGP